MLVLAGVVRILERQLQEIGVLACSIDDASAVSAILVQRLLLVEVLDSGLNLRVGSFVLSQLQRLHDWQLTQASTK